MAEAQAPAVVALTMRQGDDESPALTSQRELKRVATESLAAAMQIQKRRLVVSDIQVEDGGSRIEMVAVIMPGVPSAVGSADASPEDLAGQLVCSVRNGHIPLFTGACLISAPPQVAFRGWKKVACRRRQLRELTAKATQRLARKWTGSFMDNWHHHACELKRKRDVVARLLQHWMHLTIATALGSWIDFVASRKRARQVCLQKEPYKSALRHAEET